MDGHEGSAPSTPVWKTGVCLSTLMPEKIGVPCEICTYVHGFADRCLKCSANGTGKVRAEVFTSARVIITPRVSVRIVR